MSFVDTHNFTFDEKEFSKFKKTIFHLYKKKIINVQKFINEKCSITQFEFEYFSTSFFLIERKDEYYNHHFQVGCFINVDYYINNDCKGEKILCIYELTHLCCC
jgi:hypothetical protein